MMARLERLAPFDLLYSVLLISPKFKDKQTEHPLAVVRHGPSRFRKRNKESTHWLWCAIGRAEFEKQTDGATRLIFIEDCARIE